MRAGSRQGVGVLQAPGGRLPALTKPLLEKSEAPRAGRPGVGPAGLRAASGPRGWPQPGPGAPPEAGWLTPPAALQGLAALLLHCALNREVRKHLRGLLAGKKPYADDSAATRATLLTVGGARGLGPGGRLEGRLDRHQTQPPRPRERPRPEPEHGRPPCGLGGAG